MENSGRILIVDDEEGWRRALSLTLQRAGFQVDTASTIAQAWELISDNVYSLAILDISMNPGDATNNEGLQLLIQLGEKGFLNTMRVVMFSGVGTKEQMREAFQHKVADFLSKDGFLDTSQFVERIQQILIRL